MTYRRNETRETVTIRVASVSDATRLAELGALTFAETYAHANTEDDMRAHLDSVFSARARALELADVDRATWIAETSDPDSNDPTAIGYATVRRDSRADGIAFQAPAELERIYVLQSRHGRGVGAALMDACVAQTQQWQCDGLWLGVWEKNPNAIGFYQRVGFSMVGKKTFQLGGDVQNDFVMARAVVTRPA
jgi:ribosomal protein S18 acetylase RimI-like enzyme